MVCWNYLSAVIPVVRIAQLVQFRNISKMSLRYLNQAEAIAIDEELFNEYKFSVDQLMELAGFSVAQAVHTVYNKKQTSKVVVVFGPGNNGGDGIVAARHLKQFGFNDVVLLGTRHPSQDLFINLTKQAEKSEVPITYDPEPFLKDDKVGLIVDALFGFSFRPPIRPELGVYMKLLTTATDRNIPVLSVDIPSGWDVNKGPDFLGASGFMPETLISLTAPKECAQYFTGQHHFIGGRFVPPALAKKFALNLPIYPGSESVVRVPIP